MPNHPLSFQTTHTCMSFISVQSLSRVWLFVTPWTVACQAPCPSPTSKAYLNSCPSGWWCHPTISSSVLPISSCLKSFPASGSFQMSVLHIRWPKYWNFSFSISPSNEYSGLISFKMDWLPGFNSTWAVNFQMFKLDLEKAAEPEIKLPTSAGSFKKQESSSKTSTSALLTTPMPLTVWITTNCGKFLKRWGYQTTWPASWEICMQVKKQQLELDMEQQTASKLGKEYVKVINSLPASRNFGKCCLSFSDSCNACKKIMNCGLKYHIQ